MRTRHAFTLLEIMIVTLILSLAIAAAGTALDQGERLNERITLENELTRKVNRTLNDLAMELRTANADPLSLIVVPPTGSPSPSPVNPAQIPTQPTPPYSYPATDMIYQYQISSGVGPTVDTKGNATFGGIMETTVHRLVYDPVAQTLTKELWDSTTTTRLWILPMVDQVVWPDALNPNPPPFAPHARGGFYIDKVGNTLAMELDLEDKYRSATGEFVLKAADSQVLFLRSTFDSNLGSAAYSSLSAESAATGDNITNAAPNILFGHLITYVTGPMQGTSPMGEISIYIQPTIGQRVVSSPTTTSNPNGNPVITVSGTTTVNGVATTTGPVTMLEGTAVAVPSGSPGMTQTTRPDKNGNITVTLTGYISGAMTVNVVVTSVTGLSTTSTKTF
jgi:prepilin-type N-terminal cleavage/methylation domain-containing protein